MFSLLRNSVVAAAIACLLVSGQVMAQEQPDGTTSTTSGAGIGKGADWGTAAEQPPGPDWSGQSDMIAIPAGRAAGARITLGRVGCPALIDGNSVWYLKQGRKVCELEGKMPFSNMRSLSGNGQYFALIKTEDGNEPAKVMVWNAVTGKRVLEVPAGEDQYFTHILFTLNRYLAVGIRADELALQIWDVESGQQVKTIEIPDRTCQVMEFSPDGRFLACVWDDGVVVLSSKSGRQVAVMQAPPPVPGVLQDDASETDSRSRRQSSRKTFNAAAQNEIRWVYHELKTLTFSPGGEELVAVTERPSPRLLCWDNRGKLVFDRFINMTGFGIDVGVHWLPGGRGWIVNGYVIDRKAGRVVLVAAPPFGIDAQPVPLDENRLLGFFGSRDQMTTFHIPWKEIDEALAYMNSDKPAILRPGQAVSLRMQLEGLRGDRQKTETALAEALGKRLEREGFKVIRDAPVVMQIVFTEKAGERLPIIEGGRFGFGGHDTGQKATEAHGSLLLELLRRDQERPFWSEDLQSSSSRLQLFEETINDATLREDMLRMLASQVDDIEIPCFVPESEEVTPLPIYLH